MFLISLLSCTVARHRARSGYRAARSGVACDYSLAATPAQPADPHDAPIPAAATPPNNASSPSATGHDSAQEITVEAPEPRFVAPTRRDRIGRIWVPVYINDRGPFRLVLDSGASGSAITMQVAQALGLPLDRSPPVMLRGVTGSALAPTIRVDSMSVGDLLLKPIMLPVLADAFGGAEGVLGANEMKDRRVFIDFRHDEIRIARSHKERAATGFLTLPFHLGRGNLLVAHATIDGVRATIIVDTGGQATIANNALRSALFRTRRRMQSTPDQIIGVTADAQTGDTIAVSSIKLGPIEIRQPGITFGEMDIFKHWNLTRRPTLLIGMETIGLFDVLIIDYKRKELQILMRGN